MNSFMSFLFDTRGCTGLRLAVRILRSRLRLFLLLIIAVFAAALSGCREPKEEPVSVPGNNITVGYVKIGSESDWRIACNRSLDEAFSADNGYYLLVNDAQQKPEKQVKAMREFISLGVDYILLDPIMESGWDASLSEAREAGIPVIVFDREVDVKEPGAYTAWIGSDFRLEGDRACAWLSAFLEKQKYDQPLNILHLQGTIGSSAQIGRTAALMDAIDDHPDWNLIDQQPGEFTTAKGKEIMAQMLDKYGSRIQVVYCENDNMAYGAIEAIHEAGMTPGPDIKNGEILILSFDAARSAMERTLRGEIAVDTECMPLYGPRLVQMIDQLEKGETLQFRNYVPEEQFSAVDGLTSVEAAGEEYPVTLVTKELIGGREY